MRIISIKNIHVKQVLSTRTQTQKTHTQTHTHTKTQDTNQFKDAKYLLMQSATIYKATENSCYHNCLTYRTTAFTNNPARIHHACNKPRIYEANQRSSPAHQAVLPGTPCYSGLLHADHLRDSHGARVRDHRPQDRAAVSPRTFRRGYNTPPPKHPHAAAGQVEQVRQLPPEISGPQGWRHPQHGRHGVREDGPARQGHEARQLRPSSCGDHQLRSPSASRQARHVAPCQQHHGSLHAGAIVYGLQVPQEGQVQAKEDRSQAGLPPHSEDHYTDQVEDHHNVVRGQEDQVRTPYQRRGLRVRQQEKENELN